jgi:hypothetical protein
MSLVEPGLAAGAAGFGAAGAGDSAAAGGSEAPDATGGSGGVSDAAAAAAFCARIFAKISAVEGFFSSISTHFSREWPWFDTVDTQCPPLVTRGFWQHPNGLTTNQAETSRYFSEPRNGTRFRGRISALDAGLAKVALPLQPVRRARAFGNPRCQLTAFS